MSGLMSKPNFWEAKSGQELIIHGRGPKLNLSRKLEVNTSIAHFLQSTSRLGCFKPPKSKNLLSANT
jgi:hypothetical protein